MSYENDPKYIEILVDFNLNVEIAKEVYFIYAIITRSRYDRYQEHYLVACAPEDALYMKDIFDNDVIYCDWNNGRVIIKVLQSTILRNITKLKLNNNVMVGKWLKI